MFSFRFDKMGFFAGVVLMGIAGGTLLATVLILILGGWENYHVLLKWIWGTAWVLCIITVLIRIAVFRWQMMRAEQAAKQEPSAAAPPAEDQAPPDSSSEGDGQAASQAESARELHP